MKNFKKIEKKDPYENVASTSQAYVRDLVDIKKLIICSRCSFIGFIISAFLFKSLFYKILIQSVIENVFLEFLIIFIICWILAVIFIISLPCIYEIIKFAYNLIVKKVIGVDSYYDIAKIFEYFLERYKKSINDNWEYDEEEYEEEYDDEDYDEYDDEDYYEDDIIEYNDNIIFVDFTK